LMLNVDVDAFASVLTVGPVVEKLWWATGMKSNRKIFSHHMFAQNLTCFCVTTAVNCHL